MSRRAGYSLLEVLVAFAILTMVLTVLLPGKTALLMRLPEKEEHFLAYDYALSRLARLEAEGFPSEMRPTEVREAYRGWQVVTQIEFLPSGPESFGDLTPSGSQYARLAVAILSDPAGSTLATAERLILLREPDGPP